MRHLKIGLAAAFAALALTALAGVGTASASELWKSIDWWPDETQGVGVNIQASLQIGTTARLEDENGQTLSTCSGANLELLIEEAGVNNSATEHSRGSFQKHSFTGCSQTTTVLGGGKWKIISATAPNGILISEGTEVTAKTPVFGISCIYKSTGAAIGTLKGSEAQGGTTTIEINGLLTGSPACSSGRWTAVYTVTNIGGLYADP